MRACHRMRGVISPLYLPPRAHDAGRDKAPMTARDTAHRRPPRDPRVSPGKVHRSSSFVNVDTGEGARDRKPLHLSNHREPGPTTFASPCRMFPSRPPHPLPLLTAHRRRRALALPRSSPRFLPWTGCLGSCASRSSTSSITSPSPPLPKHNSELAVA
ncbi:uncharacterized protein LOC119317461 isoform X1 [Triticum dicoccoides]|uniref:uncharacterized protein LOC119317461 isoform X1 n=1 Tax=Triticum dicoccoides TaxID=85692 RepID=UPI001891E6C8|nr:uncharacterized protein LOC119317461 isoform X1 [Triticum dicoccoides]